MYLYVVFLDDVLVFVCVCVCVCVCVRVCVCELLETRRFNTLLCCQKVHVCLFYRPSHHYFSTQGGIPPIRVNAQRRGSDKVLISRLIIWTYLFFSNMA